MNTLQNCSRMLDKNRSPGEEEIKSAIGAEAYKAWSIMRQYLDENYDFPPKMVFAGANYGWAVRYRRSGKTLCTLFPEYGAFTSLIVLGREEVSKVISFADELSEDMLTVINYTNQLHDGRWQWLRVCSVNQINDIKILLRAKRNPKKK